MTDQKTTHKWDAYVAEAAVDDFVLELPDGDTVAFKNPTGPALLQIGEGTRRGDLDQILHAIAGDAYPRMIELMENAGHAALASLVEDLMDHFGLYEPVALQSPTGKRINVSRPTEIRRHLNQGWRPVGELGASLA